MKKIATVIFSAVMALSFVACSAEPSDLTAGERVITWNNYVETCDAYVNDYYKYIMPSAFDQDNAEYEVTSKVYDEEGTQVDNVGNMFLVKEEGKYTIEFTAFDGEKAHTAKTVVSALKRTKYSLADTNFIYGLNEEIDLTGKVVPSQDGTVFYQVTKDDRSIGLVANKFTPQELGSYEVTAKQERQPEFIFSLEVVDADKYPFANGMVEDSTSAEQAITATPVYTQANDAKTNSATINVTHDDAAKFEENSNGSTKIAVEFPESSNQFDLPIMIAPRFSKTYYQALANGGYEYVAVRMRVEDVQEIANYGLLFFSAANGKSISFRRCAQNGTLSGSGSDTALWSGKGYQKSAWGWFELLIPMTEFLAEYSPNMQLMKLRTFENNYGKLNIYIDNIYAVKALDGENLERNALKGDTFNLSELKINDTTDVDGLLFDYKVDGLSETFNGEAITLAEEGDYVLEVRVRNRYGVRKAQVVVGDNYSLPATSYAVVKEFASADDVIVSGISDVNTSNASKQATVTYTTDVKYDDATSQGSICISGIEGNSWADIFVKPTGSKAYYQFLKDNGYKYVTVRLGLIAKANDNAVYLYAGGTTVLHQNIATSTVQYYDAAAGTLKALGGKGELYKYLTVGTESWTEISISIDEFLNNYNAQGTPILRVFGSYSNSDIYLDGVFVTKTGTLA